jgi:hypothetical protein
MQSTNVYIRARTIVREQGTVALPIRDAGFLGRAADYGGGASGSLGVKDNSNRLKVSAAPSPVMADEAPIVRGAPQEPEPAKISSTQC